LTSNLHTARLFARLLGAVYLVAFASLWSQLPGLIGEAGILPAQAWLERMTEWMGPDHAWRAPTICWWVGASDLVLSVMCALGVAASLVAVLGATPPMLWLVLWALYLSLCTVGQLFLNFPWDNLLLEAGLVAVLLFDRTGRPNLLGWWMLRLLLVKVMWLSGAAKWLSEDPTWTVATALDYHFWTQPLPNPLAWHAHHLGPAFHRALVYVTWVVELGLPLLVFGPRWCRRFCFLGVVGLMLGIAATGNYGFYNPLVCVIALGVLDDGDLKRVWRPLHDQGVMAGAHLVQLLAAMAILSLSVLESARHTVGLGLAPDFVSEGLEVVAPFRSVNGYGLFATMTTTRQEIIVEGSRDGRVWQPYEFAYKPGDTGRMPRQVAPHMPRLDWQLWFAAQGGRRQTAWVRPLLDRLQQATPEVLVLLEHDPFGGVPPRYLRARLFEYRFTTPEERVQTGDWWTRSFVRDLTPVLERR